MSSQHLIEAVFLFCRRVDIVVSCVVSVLFSTKRSATIDTNRKQKHLCTYIWLFVRTVSICRVHSLQQLFFYFIGRRRVRGECGVMYKWWYQPKDAQSTDVSGSTRNWQCEELKTEQGLSMSSLFFAACCCGECVRLSVVRYGVLCVSVVTYQRTRNHRYY